MSWRDIWPENPSDDFSDEFLDAFESEVEKRLRDGVPKNIEIQPKYKLANWDAELRRLVGERNG